MGRPCQRGQFKQAEIKLIATTFQRHPTNASHRWRCLMQPGAQQAARHI